MNPFFNNDGRIAALVLSAKRWEGTRWMANSAVCQVGASCHLAAASLLKESGFEIDLKALPRVIASWARDHKESKVKEWFDGRPDFSSIDGSPEQLLARLSPGDVAGFKCGLCVHHVGIILPDGKFFQCLEATGAVILSQTEREFKKRLHRVWRPLSL